MPTFATPTPVAVTMQLAGAQVVLIAGERTDTVVSVEPVDRANPAHVKVADKTKVAFADGRLSIRTTASGDQDGSIAVTVALPTGSSLITYLAHSSVEAGGAFGECELHLARSRVRLDRAAAVQANIAAGEVTVGHVAGRTDVEGSAADVRIGEARGAVRLATSAGRVRIGHAGADLDLSSGAGAFDIDHADGAVTAKTGDGAIRIGRLTRGRAELRNSSGTIQVGIAEGVAARVDAGSKRGTVRNTVTGSEGGNVTVLARSRHGDVVVHRAQEASVAVTK